MGISGNYNNHIELIVYFSALFISQRQRNCLLVHRDDIAPDKDSRQLGIYPPLFGFIGYFKF